MVSIVKSMLLMVTGVGMKCPLLSAGIGDPPCFITVVLVVCESCNHRQFDDLRT